MAVEMAGEDAVPYTGPKPYAMSAGLIVPGALDLDCEERLWVPQSRDVWFRPLVLSTSQGYFVNILRVPYPYLYPAILVFSILGVYAVNGSVVDVWIMLIMGVLGWVLRKLDFETAPVVLGVVLAPMIELSLRQSLAMSDGHYAIFLQRPIAAGLLGVGLLLVLLNLYAFIRRGLDWRARMALAERGEET